ncbi:MAG TPA: alpha/beta fold hydrolase [Candidatus Limnocylindria bacterium]
MAWSLARRTGAGRIAVPTLLLYGERDVRATATVAEAMHAQIPGSQLVFMPGAGHMGHLESPDLFNAEVRSFLRTVEAAM